MAPIHRKANWKKLIDDAEIQVFDNCGPNNAHSEPCIRALEAGKHTIVEKPLALTVDEAVRMAEAAQQASKKGVKNMVAFSNRFAPAVLLARRLIQEGKIGTLHHYRAAFLQDWLIDPKFPLAWRLKRELAGSGVLGDLNAHSIDLARFLTGLEITEVCGTTKTFVKERPEGVAEQNSESCGFGKSGKRADDDPEHSYEKAVYPFGLLLHTTGHGLGDHEEGCKEKAPSQEIMQRIHHPFHVHQVQHRIDGHCTQHA